jgi:hypothetical protein
VAKQLETLTEDVLDAAVVKLKAGLTARIAAINNDKLDGITLGTPLEQDFYLGGAANVPSGRTPAYIITDGGTGESGGFSEEGAHELRYNFQLVVFMLDEDLDRQRLARRLLRLERAVIETLWDDVPEEQLVCANGTHPHLWPARLQPGPVFNPETNGEPFRQWRACVFEVQTYA